jgi:hypothetical protein
MSILTLTLTSAALYGVLYLALIHRCVQRTPPDIGLTAPPPVKPPPPIQGASVLAVPFDPATAKALAQLCAEHDATPEQIVRRCVRVQAAQEMGR